MYSISDTNAKVDFLFSENDSFHVNCYPSYLPTDIQSNMPTAIPQTLKFASSLGLIPDN